jgi:hypothetical protein
MLGEMITVDPDTKIILAGKNPVYHAKLCPVCNGRRYLEAVQSSTGFEPNHSCETCGGFGVVSDGGEYMMHTYTEEGERVYYSPNSGLYFAKN